MSYEAELIALAVLLYLYDATVLLFANEAVLISVGADRWTYAIGSNGFVLLGRQIRLLNPFTPYRPTFRLNWDFRSLGTAGVCSQSWTRHVSALKGLAFLGPVAATALFVMVPLGLFTGAGSLAMVPALVGLYGSTLLGLIVIYRRRTVLALGRERLVGIALECLLCPPFAVNMLRRISLAVPVKESLPLAAVRLLSHRQWQALREQLLARLDAGISELAEGSAEAALLEAQKLRLLDLGRP